MQFKTLVTFVSCAVMAVALPAENIVARTTPGQDAQNKCNAGLEVQCCNSVIAGIGLGCLDLDREHLPLSIVSRKLLNNHQ